MTSKQTILDAIRRRSVPPVELPRLEGAWIEYADCRRQFAEALAGVGGRCVEVADVAELQRQLDQLPAYTAAAQRCVLVPELGGGNVDFGAIDDPHQLQDVDFAILSGEFAVAENAAIWWTDDGTQHRVLPFLTQHLALVVPADQIVSNMHQAYERLAFTGRRFGVFISGPSKTADIEQSLVIGAHGARSLTVFLLG